MIYFYHDSEKCEKPSHATTNMAILYSGKFWPGGNFDIFGAFLPDRQNLTRQIFKAIQCLVKHSDHPSKYFPSNI